MAALKNALTVERKNGEIFSPIRKKWLAETPEERVRQEYLRVLVNEYAYDIDQIDGEVSVTGRGSGDARADFLIWRAGHSGPMSALLVIGLFWMNFGSGSSSIRR